MTDQEIQLKEEAATVALEDQPDPCFIWMAGQVWIADARGKLFATKNAETRKKGPMIWRANARIITDPVDVAACEALWGKLK